MDASQRFNLIAFAAFAISILLAMYLTKELLNAFLVSFFLAYAIYPIDRDILKISGKKRTSSFLTIALIFTFLAIIAFAAVNAMLTESYNLMGAGSTSHIQTQATELSDYLTALAERYLPIQATDYIDSLGDIPTALVAAFIPLLREWVGNIAMSLPVYLTQALVAVFVTYYFLVDGARFVSKAVELLPRKDVTTRFLSELNAIYNALIRVFFVAAMIVAAIGSAGFFLLGVPYPVLFGAIMGITAIIPMVGATAVYVPVALYFLLIQDYTRAVLVVAFGIIFLGVLPNNILIPRLASRAASIHPLVALLAFTAPILVVGPVGVIVGPIVYGFALAAYRTMEYFRTIRAEAPASNDATE
jgi:predicted PurR-regulated permease PerM